MTKTRCLLPAGGGTEGRIEKERELESTLELLEAGLTDPHWLFGGWCEGVPRRTLGAENVPAVSAVVLNEQRGGKKSPVTRGDQSEVAISERLLPS